MKTNRSIVTLLFLFVTFTIQAQHDYDGQGLIYSNNGNVGIGTTNPTSKFDINGLLKVSNGNTIVSGFFNGGMDQIGEESLLHIGGSGMFNNYGILLGATPTVSTPHVQKHAFIVKTSLGTGTSHTEKFRVTAEGNVGIGLTNPHSKLTIGNGNLSVREGHIMIEDQNIDISPSSPVGNNYRIGLFRGNLTIPTTLNYEQYNLGYLEFTRYGSWGSIAKLHIGRIWGGTQQQQVFMAQVIDDPTGYPNQSSHISFNTDQVNNSAVLYVGKGSSSINTRHSAIFENNVGIGKTPVHKLDVSGSIDASQYYVNGQAINFNNAVTSVWGQSGTTVNYVGGNVGIGTATPGYQLDVTGTVNATEIRINGQVLDLASANLWDASGNDIQYNTGGKVGINTTNLVGDYSLFVKDGIITEKVVVELEGEWPDYVFNPTYQLPSLTELADYIQQHQHLPEIPSAEEITAEGLNLGEMEALMIKKIEELTLYAIEQEKKDGSLEKENEELKKKNERLEARVEQMESEKEAEINDLKKRLEKLEGIISTLTKD